jgi:hypothetical protein
MYGGFYRMAVSLKCDRKHITLTEIPVNEMNMKAGFLLLCKEKKTY